MRLLTKQRLTRYGTLGGGASRRGAALIIALVAVMTVAMLGASYLQVTSSLVKRQTHAADQMRAFYVAEAGLAESFQAVRMGRSGVVGSLGAPALHGDGLVWVEAVELETGSLRLDSTGLVGSGRSSLSLLVEPIELNLGFFADEDLVIDNVIMVDGWNSDAGTYQEAQSDFESVTVDWDRYEIDEDYFVYDNIELNVVLIEHTFYDYVYRDGNTFYFRDSVSDENLEWTADARAYFNRVKGKPPEAPLDPNLVLDPTDPGGKGWGDSMGDSGPLDPVDDGIPDGDGSAGGAQMGSNGEIRFQIPSDQSAEIWGDLRPGPGRGVTGLTNVELSGEVSPRSAPIELPPIELPAVSLEPALRHEGLLPLFIPQGTTGYDSITVAPDADLVIRGPATVVIGNLLLEPGASLLLDTRDGDVSLYVTGKADFQLGSAITTTGDKPEEMTMQVAAPGVGSTGPTVNLEGTSQFYGTIYAPETDVHIGSEFEVFGGIVAKRLSVGQGARLHSDNSGYSGSPIPEILGWRTIEIPPAARRQGNPFRIMGVERSAAVPMAVAHDLGKVQLELVYVDDIGLTRTFAGLEDTFDWSRVDSIVSAERKSTREKELDDDGSGDGTDEDPGEEEPPTEVPVVSPEVAEALASLIAQDLRDALMPLTPLSNDDLHAVVTKNMMRSPEMGDVLQAQKLEAGLMSRLIAGETELTSGELKRTLMANTPLPASILDELKLSPDSLNDGDLQDVLDAN